MDFLNANREGLLWAIGEAIILTMILWFETPESLATTTNGILTFLALIFFGYVQWMYWIDRRRTAPRVDKHLMLVLFVVAIISITALCVLNWNSGSF